jgi:LmbE family N-acetylglucosaminyl deacetylase
MLGFKPNLPADATVLCLGAHCDDIEIGCSGTLMELQAQHAELRFEWVVFSGDDEREAETRAAARRIMGEHGNYNVAVHRYRGSYLPYCAPEVKNCFESIKSTISPALIFTHFLHDRHQDHRVIAELTWNTFRNHGILEYEIPKFEGDLAHPNVYVPLSTTTLERKIDALMTSFPSQRFAEAFHARKLAISF